MVEEDGREKKWLAKKKIRLLQWAPLYFPSSSSMKLNYRRFS